MFEVHNCEIFLFVKEIKEKSNVVFLPPFFAKRTLEIIQIQRPEHGTQQIFFFNDRVHFQCQTHLIIVPHPLVSFVSIRGFHCVVLYHGQTHCTNLVIGQESPFSGVFPWGSLSTGRSSQSILIRIDKLKCSAISS